MADAVSRGLVVRMYSMCTQSDHGQLMDLLRAIPVERQLRTAVQYVRIRVILNSNSIKNYLRFALVSVGGIIFSLNCARTRMCVKRHPNCICRIRVVVSVNCSIVESLFCKFNFSSRKRQNYRSFLSYILSPFLSQENCFYKISLYTYFRKLFCC